MAKYRVKFIEKVFYEVDVEADDEYEAEEKANVLFGEDDDSIKVTDQYIYHTDVREVR